MTTSLFVSPIDSDTDANFQAWGSQVSAQLAAIGLTKTADTGQINWSSASVAGYPGAVGYEIWAFNDATQSANPIFFKLSYGASAATTPILQFTLGTGSDGAGNITGSLKSNTITLSGNTTLGSAYPSYLSYSAADGWLGVALKLGMDSQTSYGIGFCISRTNDTTGAVTGDAFNCMVGYQLGYSGSGYTICAPTNQKFPLNGIFLEGPAIATWPYNLASSYADGDIQAVPLFALAPAIQVDAKRCVAILSDVPVGTSFSLAIVGSTPRTFIQVGTAFGQPIASQPQYGTCMLWA